MKKNWITWHHSQRSRNLANDLKLPILEYVNNSTLFSRHFFSSIWTCYILIRHRPLTIYIQYSFLLLLIIAIYKLCNVRKVQVICDCHTKALRKKLENPLANLFWGLKKLSFSLADLSIISNKGLIADVEKLTDKYFILPDKIPKINLAQEFTPSDAFCVFVCSYAVDEPLTEIIKAAEELHDEIQIFCTGSIPNSLSELKSQTFNNIYFTDYLEDNDYINLLSNAQCIIALTTENNCLQCAGYEALSLEIPVVLSKTQALKNYFKDSAIFVENEANSIVLGIKKSIQHREVLIQRIKRMKKIRTIEYEEKMNKLRRIVDRQFSAGIK